MSIESVRRATPTHIPQTRGGQAPRRRRTHRVDTFERPHRVRGARRHHPVTNYSQADVTSAAGRHRNNVDLVRASADRNHVPRDLAFAVAFHESKFDENAGSPTGVRGVMQVTQRTARGLGFDRDVNEQNIEAGMRVLRNAIDRAGSDRSYGELARYYNGSSPAQQAEWARLVEQARRYTGGL